MYPSIWLYIYISIYLSTHVYLSIYLSVYGSTAFVNLDRFFSSSIYTQSVELLRRGISLSQSRYLHTEQHEHRKMHTDIHASSGIRAHDPSIQAGEDDSCLRTPGYCGRLGSLYE
jgi:hypothetical protein